MSKDVWVSAAGSTYRAGADDFINGQLVVLLFRLLAGAELLDQDRLELRLGRDRQPMRAGQLHRHARRRWSRSGQIHEEPTEVAKVMDYLAREDIVKEFSERTLFLPAHKGVVEKGLDFKTDDAQAKAALDMFVTSTTSLSDIAQKLPGWYWSDTFYGALVTRVSQAAAGEMKLDEAFTRIDADIAAKVKDSGL